MLPELVGKPGNAERRMSEHASRKARLLDLAVGYMMPPTQRRSTSIGRIGRPPVTMPAAAPLSEMVSKILRGFCTRASTISSDGTTYSVARKHVCQADAGALERLAENECELDLDARRAVIGVRHLGAVGDHHVVEQMSVIRFVDLRGLLHRLRGEADLVADQLAALSDLLALDSFWIA